MNMIDSAAVALLPAERRTDDIDRDERMLAKYAGTRDARLRDALIERYMPLARALAGRYASKREPLEDLVQVANEGLIKAVDRFEPERGLRFSSYASPVILGHLRHHFRDNTQRVHLTRNLQELAMRVRSERAVAESELGRLPTAAELATRINRDESVVQEALQVLATRDPNSLDAPVSSDLTDDGGATMIDTVGRTEPGYDRAEASADISRLDFTEREREILRLRFGRSLTQREIGEQVGISQMQVSRVLRACLERMLAAIDSGSHEPALA